MKDKVMGFFPMCADVLHAGHCLAIEEAKRHCDYLIVGLNCKPDGKNPVQSVFERYIQLKANKNIDEIIPYEGAADLSMMVGALRYDVRFLGDDYIGKDWDGKEIEAILDIPPYFIVRCGYSSTDLKERIRSKENEI